MGAAEKKKSFKTKRDRPVNIEPAIRSTSIDVSAGPGSMSTAEPAGRAGDGIAHADALKVGHSCFVPHASLR